MDLHPQAKGGRRRHFLWTADHLVPALHPLPGQNGGQAPSQEREPHESGKRGKVIGLHPAKFDSAAAVFDGRSRSAYCAPRGAETCSCTISHSGPVFSHITVQRNSPSLFFPSFATST